MFYIFRTVVGVVGGFYTADRIDICSCSNENNAKNEIVKISRNEFSEIEFEWEQNDYEGYLFEEEENTYLKIIYGYEPSFTRPLIG